jgi:putative tryptophan/tyrosine transport system substrate-binding protein
MGDLAVSAAPLPVARTPKFMRALVLVLAAAAAGACGPASTPPPSRYVAYLDDDHAVARRVFADFTRQLDASRRAGGPAERYEFIVAKPTDEASIRHALARARMDRADLIVATSWPIALAAREAGGDTPVLFMSHPDPVDKRLVADMAAPGGNMSGVTFHMPLDLKRVELLREIVPGARSLGILCDGWYLGLETTRNVLAEARTRFGFEVHVLVADDPARAASLLAQAPYSRIDAWYVPDTLLSFTHGDALLELLAARRVPAVFGPVSFAEKGGMAALYQRARPVQERLPVLARMVLEGTPPGRIPVERPVAVTLAVNLDAARRAGITMPPAVLRRADRVFGASPAP